MQNISMRTTIEMKDEHRAKLLEIAGRRGEKGFSDLVAEAISSFLSDLERREVARGRARELRAVAADLRAHWR
jgi:predicted DNA-binding protein